MPQYLAYQWIHPDHPDWTCAVRQFDAGNKNAMVGLQIPWPRWPEYDDDEEGQEHTLHWKDIYDRAAEAVDKAVYLVRRKTMGENFPKHEVISCLLQMHEQLLHTVCTLWPKEEHLRLFYAFAADRVGMVTEIEALRLGKVVTVVKGRARIREYEEYNLLLKK